MIISRSEEREQDAREQDAVDDAAQFPQAENTDNREREIRSGVPEVRDAEDWAIVRKKVIGFVLCDAWHEEEEPRDDQRDYSGDEKTGANTFHDPFTLC